jgi:hypothetical protein
MDEHRVVDAANDDSSLTSAIKLQDKAGAKPLIRGRNEGIKSAQRIAKISVLTLLTIGIVEL